MYMSSGYEGMEPIKHCQVGNVYSVVFFEMTGLVSRHLG